MKLTRRDFFYSIVAIISLLSMALTLFNIFVPQHFLWGDAPFHRQIEDYRGQGEIGAVTFNVTWRYFTTNQTLNSTMNEHWQNNTLTNTVSLPNTPIDIYKQDGYEWQARVTTSLNGCATVDASKLNLTQGDYYIKVSCTVHFIEGGKETYFFHCLFTFNQNSEKEHLQQITLQHALWDESST